MRCATVALALSILSLAAGAKERGHISVTATASVYDPPGDAGATPMVGVRVDYWLSSYLSLAGNVSWAEYDNTTYVPVSLDGILHPLGSRALDPYVGAGVGVNYRSSSADNGTSTTMGVELVTGLSYNPGGSVGFSVEARYRVEDLGEAGESGSWSLGGGITGTWSGRL